MGAMGAGILSDNRQLIYVHDLCFGTARNVETPRGGIAGHIIPAAISRHRNAFDKAIWGSQVSATAGRREKNTENTGNEEWRTTDGHKDLIFERELLEVARRRTGFQDDESVRPNAPPGQKR